MTHKLKVTVRYVAHRIWSVCIGDQEDGRSYRTITIAHYETRYPADAYAKRLRKALKDF